MESNPTDLPELSKPTFKRSNRRKTSKITGEKHELKFYCAWQWEGEKIIGTECFFDTAIIQKEMALYQEKMNAE